MDAQAIPTLGEIQRLNAILLAIAGLTLLLMVSPAASLSCVVGGAFVIANLVILNWLGQLIVAAAARSAQSPLSMVAIPLKLLLFGGLVYLALAKTGIDGIGFGVGVTTQPVAVIVEALRARARAQRSRNDLEERSR